jgi:hypothetical protein
VRVTTYELRQIVVHPQQYVANKRAQSQQQDSPFPANPQRAWFEAAIRAFFRGGRTEASLRTQFDASVARSTVQRNRDTLIRNGELLLDQFIEWDRTEIRAPAAPPFFRTPTCAWRGHLLAVPPHLSYIDATRYRLRQLWTDRELDANDDDAALVAAATRLCAEGELGAGSITSVEVWQLRKGTQNSWTDTELDDVEDELEGRLNAVEAQLGT